MYNHTAILLLRYGVSVSLPGEEDESESLALTVEPPDILSESSPEGGSLLLSLLLLLVLLLLLLLLPGASSWCSMSLSTMAYTSA